MTIKVGPIKEIYDFSPICISNANVMEMDLNSKYLTLKLILILKLNFEECGPSFIVVIIVQWHRCYDK